MLRPEQMSKVSVTGSKRVMDDVIEAVHDLHLLHVTDYDDTWQGFDPGDPLEGAEEASDKLVTVRSIESILDVEEEDAGPTRIVTEEALEEELEELRSRVNELDDRRDELRDELRTVEERIDAAEPFADLGIDLDLLHGYRSLQVSVGRGKRDAIARALDDADAVEEYELYTGDSSDVVGVFARSRDDAEEDALQDALVGAEFAGLEVPDATESPEEYVRDLEHRRQQLRSRLNTVENELEEVKVDAAGFLLAAEEKLAIDVQKTEAPLSFATTENAFVAEGWIPTERYPDFQRAVVDAVGDHAEVEEIERAQFTSSGETAVRERVEGASAAATDGGRPAGDGPASAEAGSATDAADATDGDHEVKADGGNVVMRNDEPPVVQDNPDVVRPFEVLVNAVSRPQYREFDPTVILFLTFPAFFGYMIGDVGYGLLYTAIGYFLYAKFDSPGIKSMGGITIFAGLFTMLFGVLYGEIFGLHLITTYFWEGALGLHGPVLEKGLSPAGVEWATGWLVISVLVGILHLNVGYVFDFAENLEFHDAKHALFESGSWILMMNGLWVWVFSHSAGAMKPEFLFTTFNGEPFSLGFAGFSAGVGLLGAAVFALGLVLLVLGEPIEAVEFLNVLVNVLSYTRLAAVLLAKAGMAFTVNLLFFGAYEHHGEFHFMLAHGPQYVAEHTPEASILFPGLVHGGAAMLLLGLVVLVLGHLLVLVLGITSAGLQAVRLEYVEFFGKFFEGGGKPYDPFGYDRQYTTED